MHRSPVLTGCCLALLLMLACPSAALAGDGHNHDAAPSGVAGPTQPRFSAVSEGFELVGVLEDRRLVLYLDHSADNRPVKDGRLDIEVGGTKLPTRALGEGVFEAVLSQPLKAGINAVAATVYAQGDTDLLAGELDIHPPTADSTSSRLTHWKRYAWMAGAALALLVPVVWLTRRWRARSSSGVGEKA
ncbi:MAG: hypothetical protein KA778_05170 [Burkholderiaceae bacterium]|nr:hypothetical protein [Burkholderiaceae bacterium]